MIFAPKFLWELHPIEGIWCHQKQYIRRPTERTGFLMCNLSDQSKKYYIQRKIHFKLFCRFDDV